MTKTPTATVPKWSSHSNITEASIQTVYFALKG